MTKKLSIYKCEICGNIIEVLHTGAGKLVCCNQEMILFEEKNADSSIEKHIPFPKKIEDGTKVKVGENTAHPMEDDHYIEWIEIINGDYVNRKYLKPGDKPEALFFVEYNNNMIIREYCNKHGLWKK